MLIEEAYKFCPICGSGGFSKKEGKNFLLCPKCNYEFYIEPVGACGVIIENEKGEILLVKRARDPKKGWFDLPGGFIDNMETVEEAAIREIREELGVKATFTGFIGTFTNPYFYKGITIPTIAAIVTATIIGEVKPADDVASCHYFSIDEAIKQKIAFDAVQKGLEEYRRIRIKL